MGALKFFAVWIFNFPVLYDCPLKRKRRKERVSEDRERGGRKGGRERERERDGEWARKESTRSSAQHGPRRRKRRKTWMYRARGNLSGGGYIFLGERLWLCTTIALRYAVTPIYRRIIARGQSEDALKHECEINTQSFVLRFAYLLLDRV